MNFKIKLIALIAFLIMIDAVGSLILPSNTHGYWYDIERIVRLFGGLSLLWLACGCALEIEQERKKCPWRIRREYIGHCPFRDFDTSPCFFRELQTHTSVGDATQTIAICKKKVKVT